MHPLVMTMFAQIVERKIREQMPHIEALEITGDLPIRKQAATAEAGTPNSVASAGTVHRPLVFRELPKSPSSS